MKKLVCVRCGGTNIETKAWVNANDDKVLDSAFVDEQDNFCRDCQEHVYFTFKEFLNEPEQDNKIDKLVENLAYDRTWDEIDFDNNDRDGIDINELRFYQGDDIEETEDFQKLLDSWKFYFRKKIMEVL